jgi:hypothetical protein
MRVEAHNQDHDPTERLPIWAAMAWPVSLLAIAAPFTHSGAHGAILAGTTIVIVGLSRVADRWARRLRVGWVLVAVGQATEALGALLDEAGVSQAAAVHVAGQLLGFLSAIWFAAAALTFLVTPRQRPATRLRHAVVSVLAGLSVFTGLTGVSFAASVALAVAWAITSRAAPPTRHATPADPRTACQHAAPSPSPRKTTVAPGADSDEVDTRRVGAAEP